MSTDKHGTSWTPYLLVFRAAKNYPADFSAIFAVFILLEVNMIGSRVTVDISVDAPREQKQLGTFGEMSGLISRFFLSFSVASPWH